MNFAPRMLLAPLPLRLTNSLCGGRRLPGLRLYSYAPCPWCVRVRVAIRRLNLHVDEVLIDFSQQYLDTLVREGGKLQVPCLRIEEESGVRWLYESGAIIRYLEERAVDGC